MCTDLQGTRYLISSNLQAEGEGNGSGPTCKFTDHASNAVHGSVAEHEFDLDWYVPSPLTCSPALTPFDSSQVDIISLL